MTNSFVNQYWIRSIGASKVFTVFYKRNPLSHCRCFNTGMGLTFKANYRSFVSTMPYIHISYGKELTCVDTHRSNFIVIGFMSKFWHLFVNSIRKLFTMAYRLCCPPLSESQQKAYRCCFKHVKKPFIRTYQSSEN